MNKKQVVLTLIIAVVLGFVLFAVQWNYGDMAAVRVAALVGLGCGVTALLRTCFKEVVAAIIIAGVLTWATPQTAQARQYADGVPFDMTVGQVQEAAAAVGATVIWFDITPPDRRCGPCLLAIAVIIIVGSIWYAACKAKQKERQLPPE